MFRKLRIIALPALLLLSLSSVSAYTDSWMKYESIDWNALFSAVKDNRGESEVVSLYTSFMNDDTDETEKARCEYTMVRYYMDRGEEEKAREHLEKEETAAGKISTDDIYAQMTRTDLTSAGYYISKDMLKGMENSKETRKLYEEYSDEVYVILMNAWRLIYTPQIAGGSNKKAIKMLTPLLDETGRMCSCNVYSLYGALATAYYNRHDYETSREFLERALSMYSGEAALLELKEKLDRK